MKTYNYYIEGLDNRNNFKSHYIEHVNKRKVIKHLINWYRNQKIKITGYSLYTFNGKENYRLKNYDVIKQFNCKTFFDYWR